MVASSAQTGSRNRCLVCGSTDIVEVGDINSSDLIRGYSRRFGLDVAGQLPGVARLSELQCQNCDLGFFSPVITGDESFYHALSVRPWYYMEDKPEFIISSRFVGASNAVLEVGSGRGAFAAYCKGEYVGLEFNPEAVAQARRAGTNVVAEPVEMHASTHASAYDVCCAFQVLEHVADPKEFVASMAAATRPGGRVIISVPNERGLPGGTINDFLNLPPHHVTRWTDRSLKALADSAGLSVEALENETVAPYHLGWYLALGLCRSLAPQLVGRPGNRVRMHFVDYALWRSLWLFGRAGALALRPMVARHARFHGVGHTVVVVMRKA